MKKITYIMLLVVVTVVLAGCGSSKQNSTGFSNKEKISVVTTIYPMKDFVSQIGGDKVEIINLVPAGMEPHDFELSTGDMGLLEEAQLLIYNGAGMEHFIDKTLQTMTNDSIVVVEAAKDVNHIQSEDGQEDPHTWLSIENAKIECMAICEALCSIDSENASFYRDNLSSYTEKLDALYEEYKTELSACNKDTIVVAHEAFGYLCDEFSLKQEGIEGLMADSEPDSGRMKEIIDMCKKEDINVIFFEELVSPKVAQTIADETGAQTMVLNPIEGLTKEQEEQNLDYIGLMKENLKALKVALQ
ncbi:MAG: metal ABC transporter solute-binding protein, Zn/Mn family [Lachnospiraceae bacterium]